MTATKKPLAVRELFARKPWPKPKKAKDFKSGNKRVKNLKSKKGKK